MSVRGNQKNPSNVLHTTASPRSCRTAHEDMPRMAES